MKMRAFCKMFLDNNITTTSFCLLYSEKAVKSFYDRICENVPNCDPQMLSFYELEIEKYEDLRGRIDSYRKLSRVRYSVIVHDTSIFKLNDSIKTHGSFESLVNYCHRSMSEMFDDMEEEFHKIYLMTNREY
jgi:hypothetical protein